LRLLKYFLAFFFTLLFSINVSALTENKLNNWLTYYYKSPNPDLMIEALDSMHSAGYFKKDNAVAPMSSFLGSIFKKNDEKLKYWVNSFTKYEDKEKLVLIYALWFADTNKSKTYLKELKTTSPYEQKIEKLLQTPFKGLENIEITSPAILDMLWGGFFATGNTVYVDRIISVLPWANVKGDIPKLLIGGSARWSLTSNALQHDKVYIHCKSILDEQPETIKNELENILQQVYSEKSPKMFFAEYQYIHPDIKEGSFEATSRKLWRVGYKYLRLEEAPDPEQKIHGLIISNAPDSYIINKYTKSGKHIVDRAENTDVHAGVFQSSDLPNEIRELEMGYENSFFLKRQATKIGITTIDSVECEMYQVTIKEYELTLYKRKDDGNPLQLGIKKENFEYKLKYLKYEKSVTPDFTLFEVPVGTTMIDVN